MRGFNAWLIRAPVLVYMAVMALAPVLGWLAAWAQTGIPPKAGLVVTMSISCACCAALAREVRRRWDRERHDRGQTSSR
jgi:hypothetical protein